MGKINSFEDLIVWQKAIDLSSQVYKQTKAFPKDEVFGLTSQIKRASNSISLNIAEGSVKSTKTFINHLYHAYGSSAEVLSSSILAKNYRDWETDRKSTRLNSSHSAKSRMPSSA